MLLGNDLPRRQMLMIGVVVLGIGTAASILPVARTSMLISAFAVVSVGAAGYLMLSRMELRLRRRNQELEQLLRQREETAVQLKKATDDALAAAEAKSSFLASMSHEIRTPINGLMGFAKLLQDTPLSRTQKEYVDIINGSGQSLLAVINDILDFSKLEAGKLVVSIEPFDLRDEVGNVADLLGARATERGITLAVSCPDNLNTMGIGDSGRVRQVLLNLVGNSVKFTENGHVFIEIRCEPESGRIRCSVHDTGIGIPEDVQKCLFQRFVQADESTTRKFGGTGLGLAISKSLVEMMNGEIGVTSEPGKGSTFWFTLPLADARAPHVESLPPTIPPGTRILILESIGINRLVLAEQLELWDVQHQFVATPKEATKCLAETNDWTAILVPQLVASQQTEFTRHIASKAKDGLKILMCSRPGNAMDAHLIDDVTIHFILAAPLGRRDRLWEMVESLNRDIPVTGDTCMVEDWMDLPSAETEFISAKTNLRVLVAEDNVVNLKLATKFLQMLDCDVDRAENGLEAIERNEKQHYDVIFMDCHMPECDGYEATRRIRIREKELEQPRVPIVALTANVMSEGRDECMAVGMDDFVTKPVSVDDLRKCLERWATRKVGDSAGSLAA